MYTLLFHQLTTLPGTQPDHLSMVISGLIAKLDGNPPTTTASVGSSADFYGFTATSSGNKEGEIPEGASDPLMELDSLGILQLVYPDAGSDNTDFLCALEELSGHFQGEEEKGESLSEHLATILNASLRCRPSSDGVKSTCAITSAKTVGGKLIDMWLFHTNGLVSKALIPLAECISDIREGKGKQVSSYLEGLNNSLRFLASAFNYVNHLQKEVAQIHVNDLALPELCKWDCVD
ncbi:hypothetical protein E2C01_037650 [Portunus trituberculatus]|uniref:Uncharacterized protein n=1 Tax=Portunus trituberculatus TaxID=210409 RepID=A0A5B7F9X0_PORTR|nr:hypothetical protein [Portunus trituberculatus]